MSADLLQQLQTALGSAFAVERELGGGGMSRVFVATEVAFGRKVVAKVLHPDLAEGVSVERFKREIAVVAKLQHPHIVPLLNAGESNGVLYYTMPLVEGESLRQRLERDIELPVSDAVRILKEMSAALAYAHRHGIVHRDVKPDNVLFSDGTAVVTDFGIAKAITAAKTHGDAPAGTLTQLGTSLGTPAYMSPEQVTADPNVDHRADIYALGCVAFEVLTGRPPFVGRNAQALMAAHASEEPEPVSRLRPTTPAPLASLVMECLAKRPADRPQSAEEINRALSAVVVTPAGSATWTAPVPARAARYRLLTGTGLVLGGLAVGAAVARWGTPPDPELPVRRWTITLPDSAPLAFVGSAAFANGRRALAIAPDGSTLVYVARIGQSTMLYTRRLDEFEARPLAGTQGAFMPFFSPDGHWVAFFSGRELKKIGVTGTGLVTLAQVTNPIDGAWTAGGRILFVVDPFYTYSVPESGGPPTRVDGVPMVGSSTESVLPGHWLLTAPDRRVSVADMAAPRHFAFTASSLISSDSMRVLDERNATLPAFLYGSGPQYAHSGHVVYASSAEEGSLIALPFDATRRRILGPPKVVLQGIRQERGPQDSPAQFALSRDGTLVYATGVNAARVVFVRRSRAGKADTLRLPRGDYGAFRLSPNGRQLLMSTWPPGAPLEIHLADLSRGTRQRVSVPAAIGQSAWWPDGESVIIVVDARGEFHSLRVSARTGEIVDTLRRGVAVFAASLDSASLLVRRRDGELWLVPRDSARPGTRVARPPAWFASFSPDGQWIQYTGEVEGRFQIMLVRASNPDERYQASPGGGAEGIWSRNGEEIVYRRDQRWYSVLISGRRGPANVAPRLLFEGPYPDVPGWSHDLMPNGDNLLLAAPREETTTQLSIVTNWFAELRRLAPPERR